MPIKRKNKLYALIQILRTIYSFNPVTFVSTLRTVFTQTVLYSKEHTCVFPRPGAMTCQGVREVIHSLRSQRFCSPIAGKRDCGIMFFIYITKNMSNFYTNNECCIEIFQSSAFREMLYWIQCYNIISVYQHSQQTAWISFTDTHTPSSPQHRESMCGSQAFPRDSWVFQKTRTAATVRHAVKSSKRVRPRECYQSYCGLCDLGFSAATGDGDGVQFLWFFYFLQ